MSAFGLSPIEPADVIAHHQSLRLVREAKRRAALSEATMAIQAVREEAADARERHDPERQTRGERARHVRMLTLLEGGHVS